MVLAKASVREYVQPKNSLLVRGRLKSGFPLQTYPICNTKFRYLYKQHYHGNHWIKNISISFDDLDKTKMAQFMNLALHNTWN